ncbi:CpsD/CapB family tyrosine-protein kinase [Tropicimonas aquimaris]|uniref:CpsD/CapB family tyrosine-protein kinase n=1 Tax=Tropicimonas aquimaris TaxID=914152 RepID=A0ABW3IL42_9RHOB
MDRLHAAIEKARAEREKALAGQPSRPLSPPPLPAGAAQDPLLGPAAAPQVPFPVSPPTDPAPTVGRGRPQVWQSLRPFDREAKELKRNRLLALRGGKEAVPFDLLRTRMLHQLKQNGWRRVGIVSPTPECGKTTVAANLAFAFSRQPDVTALLLDFDLRRPRLAKMLGQNVEHGMADVLRGSVSFAEHALKLSENVAIGMNVEPATAPSELLQSERTVSALARIEAEFAPDVVLFDLPPMLSTDDNYGFLQRVDCVLLLAAAEQTTIDQIDVSLRQLNDLTTVLGVVLNKNRFSSSTYGYNSDYYY